jgi:hypothetical protein
METVIVRCRLCGKPMNVPKTIMMVFTFDPSVCNQCRDHIPKGNWNTDDDSRSRGVGGGVNVPYDQGHK